MYGLSKALAAICVDYPSRKTWNYDSARGLIRVSSMNSPSRVAWVGDSLAPNYSINYFATSYPDMRHSDGSNFVFFDGHTEYFNSSEIYMRADRYDSEVPSAPWF
jgi:prepilin-type processing-associated H-X9-DG protein